MKTLYEKFEGEREPQFSGVALKTRPSSGSVPKFSEPDVPESVPNS